MSQQKYTSRIEVDTDTLSEIAGQLDTASQINQDLAIDVGVTAAKVLAVLSLDPLGQGTEAGTLLTGVSAKFLIFSGTHAILSKNVVLARDSYIEVEKIASSILETRDDLVPELFYSLGAASTSEGWIGEMIAQKVPGAPMISQALSRLLFGMGYYADIKFNGEEFAHRRYNERLSELGMSSSWRRDAGKYLQSISRKTGLSRDLEESSIRSQQIDGNKDFESAIEGMILMPVTPAEWAHNLELVGRGEDTLDQLNTNSGDIIEQDGVRVQMVRDGEGNIVAANVYIPGTDENAWATRGGISTWPSNVEAINADSLDTLAEATPMMQLADRALQEAGVGSGIPVNLGGFSQGAATAKALSTNKEFTSKYKLNYLYLQGGPVGDLKTNPTLSTTVVKDKNDLVPRLQGNSADFLPNTNIQSIETDYNSLQKNGSNTPVHGYREYAEVTQSMPEANVVHPQMQALRQQVDMASTASGTMAKPSASPSQMPADENYIVSGSTFEENTTPAEIELNRTIGMTAGGYQVAEDLLDNTSLLGPELPDLPDDFVPQDVYSSYVESLSDENKKYLNAVTVGPVPVFLDYRDGLFDIPTSAPAAAPTIAPYTTYAPATAG